MIPGYLDDLVVGAKAETRGRTIGETDVLGFAGLSGDFHPLHTNAVYASKSSFGQRIAHGLLTLAVTTGLLTLSPDTITSFYGMNRVRFLRPVNFGDTIHAESEVADVQPREDGTGKVILQVGVFNQDDQQVAALEMMFIVKSRDA